MRIDPAPSLACASETMPEATAAALPPDEPPGVRVVSHGFRAGPKRCGSVTGRIPSSGTLVLPTMMAPASRSRRTTEPSMGGSQSPVARMPKVVRMPWVRARMSLMAIGTPASGRWSPALTRVGLLERALGHQRDEGVQLSVEALDRPERGLHQLACAELAVAHQGGLVAGGLEQDLVGHASSSPHRARRMHARGKIAAVSDDRVPDGVVRVRAPNPSPLTLDGTNTYVVGGWVVDPGPDDDGHLDRVSDAVSENACGGSPEGIVLTHAHPDHAEGAPRLAERLGDVRVVRPNEGDEVGPFRALATPGHAPDHVCLLFGRTLFCGDTVLGAGSVFIGPGEGSMSSYLASLRRLRELELDALCPGHGPFVWSPHEKIEEYLAHRLDRERRLLAALEAGARTRDEMLDAAWPEVPQALRPAAALTLEAHLEKLGEEGRLPKGVA